MRIVVLDGYTENPGDLSWDGFRALGALEVYDRTDAEHILERADGAEILITNKTPLSAPVIDKLKNLQYIGLLSTGYNVVDLDAARLRGIPVTNIPTYGTQAVAQHVFALLLEVCQRVGHHSDAVMAGRWASSKDFCFWDYPLIELAGKTMGIVGFGRIGQAVKKIAEAFGMAVLVNDPAGSALSIPLGELLRRSDVVTLNCPLLPETQGMINRDSIAEMKDGAILINTARGPLVNESDLADALKRGKLYAAAVDVVSVEPICADNPLIGLKNAIITPHIAWAPKESRARLMDIAVGNLRAFLRGDAENVVNL